MAERTGSPVLHTLWSYVLELDLTMPYKDTRRLGNSHMEGGPGPLPALCLLRPRADNIHGINCS
jgi:hypothetical protein